MKTKFSYTCPACEHEMKIECFFGSEPSGLSGPPEDYDPGSDDEFDIEQCPKCRFGFNLGILANEASEQAARDRSDYWESKRDRDDE